MNYPCELSPLKKHNYIHTHHACRQLITDNYQMAQWGKMVWINDWFCVFTMWRWMMCVSAEHSLDMVRGDVCIYVCARDKSVQGWSLCESVHGLSVNIFSRSFQICLYASLCLVTESALYFPKIHLFCLHLLNSFPEGILWCVSNSELHKMFAYDFIYVSVCPGDWQPIHLLVCLKVQLDHDFN